MNVTCMTCMFQMCALATAKLHSLVQTQLISSSAEASYIIGCLNSIILRAVEGTYRGGTRGGFCNF